MAEKANYLSRNVQGKAKRKLRLAPKGWHRTATTEPAPSAPNLSTYGGALIKTVENTTEDELRAKSGRGKGRRGLCTRRRESKHSRKEKRGMSPCAERGGKKSRKVTNRKPNITKNEENKEKKACLAVRQ